MKILLKLFDLQRYYKKRYYLKTKEKNCNSLKKRKKKKCNNERFENIFIIKVERK